MARCKQCNKFMFLGSKSGYCENCEQLIAKQKAKEEEDRIFMETQRKAKEEAEFKAREAQRKAQEEANRKAQEEAQRKAKEEAELRAREEAQRKAKEEAELRAREAQRKAQEEAQRKAKEEAELRAREEAQRKAKEEAELRAREEAQRKAKEEAEHEAKEEAKRLEKKRRYFNSSNQFPLRCDIFFGDTVKEVQQKERNYFRTISDYLLVSFGAVSGIDGGITRYFFSKDGLLVHMSYSYTITYKYLGMIGSDNSASRKQFEISEMLRKGIIAKYGEPQYHTNIAEKMINMKPKGSEYEDIIAEASKYDTIPQKFYSLESSTFPMDNSGWIIHLDNAHIVIHLSQSSGVNVRDDEGGCCVDLGYTFFIQPEYDMLIKTTAQKEASEKAAQKKQEEDFFKDL